jgi:hypothetical protein
MTYADSTQRAALIGGLRALAGYLESNPEVPSPTYAECYIFPPGGTCAETPAEIDVVAARLGRTASPTDAGRHAGQHYVVTRSFGPVEYRAVAICKDHPRHDDNPDDESGQAK